MVVASDVLLSPNILVPAVETCEHAVDRGGASARQVKLGWSTALGGALEFEFEAKIGALVNFAAQSERMVPIVTLHCLHA